MSVNENNTMAGLDGLSLEGISSHNFVGNVDVIIFPEAKEISATSFPALEGEVLVRPNKFKPGETEVCMCIQETPVMYCLVKIGSFTGMELDLEEYVRNNMHTIRKMAIYRKDRFESTGFTVHKVHATNNVRGMLLRRFGYVEEVGTI